jgi:hypothetical protein
MWGLTLGRHVFIKRGLSYRNYIATLAHEQCHVKQYEREGIMMYLMYIIEYFKVGYWNISYEVEARQYAKEFMEQNHDKSA